MKAVILKEFGDVDNLVEQDIPIPVIKEDEVLIKIKALSINPVDIKTRKGRSLGPSLKNENPLILGWDISGVITETGTAVSSLKAGDEVFGMINFPGHGKAYAEYVAAPAAHLAVKPSAVSHQQAAASTLAALTAWQCLVKHAKIKKGQRVLINAASGGVGHYAIQIAKYLGAYVIGISSGTNKDFVLGLGADEHVDYTTQRIDEAIKNVDLVLDGMGGEGVESLLAVTNKGGTIITLPSGGKNFTDMAQAKGVNWHHYSVVSDGTDQQIIADLLRIGKLQSFISQIFNFQEIRQAHLQIESGRTKGKLVVTL